MSYPCIFTNGKIACLIENRDQANRFRDECIKSGMPVKILLGDASWDWESGTPLDESYISRSRHIGLLVPGDDTSALQDFKAFLPNPSFSLRAPEGIYAVWRFSQWEAWSMVSALADTAAELFQVCRVVWLPVPNAMPGVSVIASGDGRAVDMYSFAQYLQHKADAIELERQQDGPPVGAPPCGPDTGAPAGTSSASDPGKETPPPRKPFRAASEIKASSTRWLWPGVIPLGSLTLLAGKPKRGKSQIAISVASIVSTGGTWPTGERCSPGNVIIMEIEDGEARIIARILAAGGDVSKISVRSQEDGALDLAGAGMAELADEAERMGGVKLLIVSPVNGHFGKSGTSDDASMRSRLYPLLGWASQNDVAVLALTHPPKDVRVFEDYFSGADALRRVARSAFVSRFSPKDEPGGQLVMECVAQTDGPGDLVMRYAFEGLHLPGGVKTSRIVWLDRDSQTMDVSASATEEDSSPSDQGMGHISPPAKEDDWTAANWLRLALKDGAQPRPDLIEEGRRLGWSAITIDQAKSQLGVVGVRQGNTSWWSLPDSAPAP